MEDQNDMNISFVRISKISEFENEAIELIKCGMNDNSKNQIRSPVKDLRSIIQIQDGRHFHVAVALR